jgi:hypothetical protein
MTEIPPPTPDSEAPEGEPEQPGMARRDFLLRGGAAVVGLVAGFAGPPLVRGLYEAYEKDKGREATEPLFENGLREWHKLAIFPGLLQIDPSVKVADSIFGKPASKPDWPQDKLIVAVQPIGVHWTLLRNIADYSRATQDKVDRVLPEIPPRLLAFWQPNRGKLVYCNADDNEGLMTPILDLPLEADGHLPITDIDIDGREVRGHVVYPYTKQLGAETETYSFIGQSTTVSNAAELNTLARNFFAGGEPIAFPAP